MVRTGFRWLSPQTRCLQGLPRRQVNGVEHEGDSGQSWARASGFGCEASGAHAMSHEPRSLHAMSLLKTEHAEARCLDRSTVALGRFFATAFKHLRIDEGSDNVCLVRWRDERVTPRTIETLDHVAASFAGF